MPYKDRDKARAKAREWYERNKEKQAKRRKVYQEHNADKVEAIRKASDKAYKKRNVDKVNAYSKAYYAKNRDRIRDEYHAARDQ